MEIFTRSIALHVAFCVTLIAVPGEVLSHRCYQCSSYLSMWCDDPFDRSSVAFSRSCHKEINSTKYSTVNVMRNMFMVLGNIFPPADYGFETYVGLYPTSNHYAPDRRRRHAQTLVAEGDAVVEVAAAKGGAVNEAGISINDEDDDVDEEDVDDEDVDEEDADGEASRRVARQYPFPKRPKRPNDAYECFKVVVKSKHNNEERAFRGCAEPAEYDICTMVLGYSKEADERVVSCHKCKKQKCNGASSLRSVHAKMAAAVAILLAWLVC